MSRFWSSKSLLWAANVGVFLGNVSFLVNRQLGTNASFSLRAFPRKDVMLEQ